jgi:hypothetical protein
MVSGATSSSMAGDEAAHRKPKRKPRAKSADEDASGDEVSKKLSQSFATFFSSDYFEHMLVYTNLLMLGIHTATGESRVCVVCVHKSIIRDYKLFLFTLLCVTISDTLGVSIYSALQLTYL